MIEREFQTNQSKLMEDLCKINSMDRGKIKHFSQVQGRPIYWTDLEQFKNLVMMNIEVPQFWHLEYVSLEDPEGRKKRQKLMPKNELTEQEVQNQERIDRHVIYLKLRVDENGRAASVYDLAELFQQFGDINVVKATETSCFIDLQDVDKAAVVANKKVSPA